MSFQDTVLAVAVPKLEETMRGLADDYMGGFEKMLEGANEHARPKIVAHLGKAAEYKWKAMQADSEEERRAYVSGVADELARAKTVVVSEAVAISEEQAQTFAAGFSKVLDAVGSAAKAVLSVVVEGLISGVISGVAGGDGDVLSGIFPGV